ncbi:MAG: InlB B-repeat-containing protein [Thomasclavelia sp.]|jgi:Leucine-rich repeat (LRR) protein|nr:InlB B-repeat-containing protein [Thomasclavelia sp.]
MKKIKKLVLPILLSLVMIGGYIPIVYAEDEVETSTSTEETQTDETSVNQEKESNNEEVKDDSSKVEENKESKVATTPTSTNKESTKVASAKTGEVTIDSTNFPDSNFLDYVKQYDTDGNGSLSESEFDNVTEMTLYANKFSDLKGIEYFTSLKLLQCNANKLTSIDLSKNTALTELELFDNQLTSLDISKNTALTSLSCENNQLTNLDVSKNTSLEALYCYDNQLTNLDVSKNTALTSLHCANNQLTNLDVSKNTALKSLGFSINQIQTIDVSKNTELVSLMCERNKMTSLDVSNNTKLHSLICFDNNLSKLDISKNLGLSWLDCSDNEITSIDVRNHTDLEWFLCNENKITTLDLSKNTKLNEYMIYFKNQNNSCFVTKKVNGTYAFDLKSYVNSTNGLVDKATMTDGSTIKTDGKVEYTSLPQSITYNYETDSVLPDTETSHTTMDVTLTPTVNYQVLFTDGEGNALSNQTVENGKDAKAPATPTREGYVFIGWDKDYSNITDAIEVKAEWVSAANASQSTIDANDKTIKQTAAKGIKSTKDLIDIMNAVVTKGDETTTKPTSVTCDKYSDITAGKVGSYNVTFTYTDDNGESINVTKVLTVEKDKTIKIDQGGTDLSNTNGSSSGTTSSGIVATGDNSNIGLFGSLFMISLLGLLMNKKRKEN